MMQGDDAGGAQMPQSQPAIAGLGITAQGRVYGKTAAQMVQYAAMAVQSGTADTIAVVWADDPLKEKARTSAAYTAKNSVPRGWRGINASNGLYSANTMYALAARRHMKKYGTTQDHFGHIAVAQREWAQRNPIAQFYGTPLTLEEYHASRYIAEPFHLYDCCLVSNGGVAVIVTSLDRARALRQPPVRILGWAQAHPGRTGVRNDDFGLVSGAASAGPRALKMAGTTLDEIDVIEVYQVAKHDRVLVSGNGGVLDYHSTLILGTDD
jgi:acetyl-CoA acetyltransferase